MMYNKRFKDVLSYQKVYLKTVKWFNNKYYLSRNLSIKKFISGNEIHSY